MKTFVTLGFYLSIFAGLFVATQLRAGEYYAYRDSAGKLVIANIKPPSGSKIIKQQTFSEITDGAVVQARKRDNEFWLLLQAENAKNCCSAAPNPGSMKPYFPDPARYSTPGVTAQLISAPDPIPPPFPVIPRVPPID